MKRESFIFYKSFYDSIKELDLLDQAQIYNAIFTFQFEGEKVELNGVCKSIFTLIIPQLEANNKRYLNGLKGGAPKNNQNAKKKQSKNNLNSIKKQPNENENENENENVNVNDNENVYNKYIVGDNNVYKEIIDHLNLRTGQHYKHSTDKTRRLIKTRLNEGFTLEDFKVVIDKMCVEWMNTDMKKYFRPETLFGTKFESYLNREVKQTTKNINLTSEEITNIFR